MPQMRHDVRPWKAAGTINRAEDMRVITGAAAAAWMLALALGISGPGAASAEETTAATTTTEDTAEMDPALKELLAKEKEARKACKIEICAILMGRQATGNDVSCHVIKTWPKQDLDKIVQKAKVSWPWGNTQCNSDIKLSRADLLAAVTKPEHTVEINDQGVSCDISRTDGEPYSFKIALSPKIDFKDGKAVKSELRWGKLEAPSVAKAVLWPATALDNQLNVLDGEIVKMVNEFIVNKCAEVKDEIPAQ